MKKMLMLPLLALAFNAQAKELKNYNEVKEAVVSGESIRIVVNLAACQRGKEAQIAPTAVASFTPSGVMVTSDHMAASLTHFSMNSPGFPNTPVNEHVVYIIQESNAVDLKVYKLDPVNYKELTEQKIIHCSLPESVRIYS